MTEYVLNEIAKLYLIEDKLRGELPATRKAKRGEHAKPIIERLQAWMSSTLGTVSKKSDMAAALRYSLVRWTALTRYINDGAIEIDNNAAERALRALALGRKNWLFAGSDSGGERAAAMYSLVETAKLNHINPQAYLEYVLANIGAQRINRVAELLPWNVVEKIRPLHKIAA